MRVTRPEIPSARLVAERDGSLVLYSTYHQGLVEALKRHLPADTRRWDGQRRAWLIDPAQAMNVADLCERHLGVRPQLPTVSAPAPPSLEVALLTIEYVGAARERPDGSVTASGWADGGWNVVFPVEALRHYFEPGAPERAKANGEGRPNSPQTLYAVLCVGQSATEDELRASFRRLARATHPDVCKEPDAAERFIRVKRAYDVLIDPGTRKRYDVGLRIEAQESRDTSAFVAIAPAHYRAPLPCGLVLARGERKLGQFWVREIVQFEDIVNPAGEVLVTSWPAGADAFERRWVRP
jgi:DnaJ domain